VVLSAAARTVCYLGPDGLRPAVGAESSRCRSQTVRACAEATTFANNTWILPSGGILSGMIDSWVCLRIGRPPKTSSRLRRDEERVKIEVKMTTLPPTHRAKSKETKDVFI
jgi:hypothetical protein